jgi:hypothetical protein
MSSNDNISRLYLTLPGNILEQIETTWQQLDHLVESLDIACINLPVRPPDTRNVADRDELQKKLIVDLQRKNIAVLGDMSSPDCLTNRKSFEKALEKTVKLNCDGIHMSADEKLYRRAREVLGENAIIGANCGTSKHLAMQLGETGADYVAFHSTAHDPELPDRPFDLLELVDWWQQLFEIPCVASDIADQSQIEALLQINADFIALGPLLWPELSRDNKLVTWLASKCPVLTKGA